MRALATSLALLSIVLAGCERPSDLAARPPVQAVERATERDVPTEVAPLPPSRLPAPERVIAIGDVHGDLDALLRALRLGGAVDADGRWIGGALWVVQTGDLLDRGDQEDEILALVARLERESSAAGGRFLALIGNHELMNAQGDFRYVTRDGFADFASFARDGRPEGSSLPRAMRGRAIAFTPGGRYARELAARNTAVVVGETVFVHGGLRAQYIEHGLEAINRDVRAFLLGEAPLSPLLAREDSPVWYRGFALRDDPATCAELTEVLARLGARRMVVGHTVQEHGIDAACDDRVFRIDVGLSRYYGGPIEVLEINGDTTRVLRGAR